MIHAHTRTGLGLDVGERTLKEFRELYLSVVPTDPHRRVLEQFDSVVGEHVNVIHDLGPQTAEIEVGSDLNARLETVGYQ